MTIIDLPFHQQFLAMGFIVAMLFIFMIGAVFLSEFIQKRMRPGIGMIWPVGLSFFVSSAPITLSNPEPSEEFVVLVFAHLGAWVYMKRKAGPALSKKANNARHAQL